MTYRTLCRRFAPVLTLAVARAAYADEPTTVPATTLTSATPAMPEWVFTLGADANYAADADLGDAGGSLSVFRSGGNVRVDHAFNADTALGLTFNGEWSHYFFRDVQAVPGADGSDSLDAYQFDIRPTLSRYLSDDLNVYGGLTITASGMADASFGDSMTYGAFAGVSYRVSPTFWVGGGVSMVTQLEDDLLIVPLLTLKWDVTPQVNLASDGLGLRATYRFDDQWSVYARARYDYRQFRLDGGEIITDGVLQDQSIPVSVGLTYDLGNQLTVAAEAGVVAYRRIEFRDDGGDTVGADEADPAAFVSIQVRYSF